MKPIIRGLILVLFHLASSNAFAEPPVAPFYEALKAMKPGGKLGQVIQREEVRTSVNGAQAWKIAYISSDVAERKTIVTALVVAPVGDAPSEGRPILAWAHGTTGAAQNCGPSQLLDPVVPLNEYFLMDGNSWTDYGIPNIDEFIKEGYIVVATDYQGLGGGGKHQYAVAGTNGRDVINSVRAAASMKEINPGNRVVVYGWSQGGGATIAAASLIEYQTAQGTAADNLQYLGFVGLAPDDVAALIPHLPADETSADKIMNELIQSNSPNVFLFAHLVMNLWGTQAAYPNLKLTDMLTEKGAEIADKLATNKCVHVLADTLSYALGDKYKSLVKPKIGNSQAWVKAFVDGSVKPVKPVAPVIIFWGTKDNAVPPVMHELYQKQMCAMGANVQRIQLPGEQTHYTTPGESASTFVPWIRDRFAGKPLANGCPNS